MLPQVTLCSHPLIAHKMALLRDKTTDARQIRTLFNEIGLLLAVDSTRDISLIPGKVVRAFSELFFRHISFLR